MLGTVAWSPSNQVSFQMFGFVKWVSGDTLLRRKDKSQAVLMKLTKENRKIDSTGSVVKERRRCTLYVLLSRENPRRVFETKQT